MPRILVTGYISLGDLEPGQHDPDSATGLTEEAYLDIISNEEGGGFSLEDLNDIEVALVD